MRALHAVPAEQIVRSDEVLVAAGRRAGVKGPQQRERERVADDGNDLGPDRTDRGEELAGVE